MTDDERVTMLQADMAANNAEHRSFKRRLDEHDEALKQQADFRVAIEKLGNGIVSVSESVDRVEQKVTRIDTRVEELEKEPGEKWKKVSWEIFKYVLLALMGAGVGYVLSRAGIG